VEAQDGDWDSEETRTSEELNMLERMKALSFLFGVGTINFRIITHVT